MQLWPDGSRNAMFLTQPRTETPLLLVLDRHARGPQQVQILTRYGNFTSIRHRSRNTTEQTKTQPDFVAGIGLPRRSPREGG